MQLLADRFVMVEDQRAVDLATGDRIVFSIGACGGQNEQRRWALRCDTLQKLHHPAIARLIDYGVIGESQRFEAWRCDGSWPGPVSHAEAMRIRASVVLRACGLSSGAPSLNAVRNSPSGPVLLPDWDVGYPGVCEETEPDLPIEARGLIAIERRVVATLTELFESTDELRPRIAALWGPEGAGKRTATADLARMARLRGFVPLSAQLFSEYADRLSGRSLFVVDATERGLGWSVLLHATLRSPRRHVLLFVGKEELPSVDAVRIEPVAVEVLVGAVCPPVGSGADGGVRRAAARAGGWPGRFARLLWRDERRADTSPGRHLRAAEQGAVYGLEQTASASLPRVDRNWPVADELATLRRRLDSAVRLIDAGRHAPGERVLRQTIGALSRREDWAHAGDGSLALAGMLTRRGRVRDAQTALQCAAEYWGRVGERGRLVDVAVESGMALIDLTRLEEAEAVLGAAIATARSARDQPRAARAATALARALFWRGRYEEAEEALGSIMQSDLLPVGAASLAAQIGVGRRALDLAVSRATEGLERARRAGKADPIADAAYGAAFAHLAVGDIVAVQQDVVSCIAAARTAHQPLRAVRSRLIQVEAFRRSGRRAAATALLDRIGKLGSTVLPPIVQARCDLLRDALTASAPLGEIVARHVAATSLEALALLVSPSENRRTADAFDSMLEDIVDILNLCQTSDDERAILVEVCRRMRARIHAAAVAFAGLDGPGWSVVAADGGRIETSIVERAATAGITVAPHRHDDRIEAAAPVRYGGAVIGALVARWAIGTPHDLSRAASLLTAAAAATAAILSAAIVRRHRPKASSTTELLGSGAAIADVRRAVDRAATAPFAVLIEGESGSGKELVARALHQSGPRRDRRFCALNCAALPDELVEAELFGHARGAFTGAVGERPGVFEEAQGGTLFLDEVGELSPRAQAKMLRVLQDGEIRRIGENVARRIDVRVVSATNRDLRQEVTAGRFRLDLLYRLDVIRMVVPPLRERREDVAVLAEHFWSEMAARMDSRATLAEPTLAALARYDWPGNVRELQNVLASLLVRSPKRGAIPPTALGPQFAEQPFAEASRLDEARRTFEERFVRAALIRSGGHRTRAAEELGVTRQGLTKLMARLGITG